MFSLNKRIENNIVITGIGIVSGAGIGITNYWRSVHNRNKYGSENYMRIANGNGKRLLPQIKWKSHLGNINMGYLNRSSKTLLVAAQKALKDSGLSEDDVDSDKIGIVTLSDKSNVETLDVVDYNTELYGLSGISPYDVANSIENSPGSHVAINLGITGLNITLSYGSSSGMDTLLYACELFDSELLDVIFVSGVELLPRINNLPDAGNIHHNKNNKPTMYPYEGAAVLVLERYDHAIKRNANIYAHVLGISNSCANHLDSKVPDKLINTSIKKALEISSLTIEDIKMIFVNLSEDSNKNEDTVDSIHKIFDMESHEFSILSSDCILGISQFVSSYFQLVTAAIALKKSRIPSLCHIKSKNLYNKITKTTSRKASMIVVNDDFGNVTAVALGE